jgi:hypothetical protein
VLSRKGKEATRIVSRKEMEAPPLWKASRQTWTPEQAQKALEPLGFTLQRDEVTREIMIIPTKMSKAGLNRHYGWGKGPGGFTYPTMRNAMEDMRNWLERTPKYTAKHGPPKIAVSKPIKIPSSAIDDLRARLNVDELQTLRGRKKIFDDTALPTALDGDYTRLSELRRAREAGETTVITPKVTRVLESPGEAIGKDDWNIFFQRGDDLPIPLADLPEVMQNYGYTRVLLKEVDRAVKQAHKLGVAPDVDTSVLNDLQAHMTAMQETLVDMSMKHLPDSAQELYDAARLVQTASFDAAQRSGVWIPGSPVAYVGRYFNHNGKARIAKIIGDIENADSEILMRLGIKQSQRFRRTTDALSIDDLNEVHAELRYQLQQEGAHPQWKKFHDDLEQVMHRNGVKVPGLTKRQKYGTDRIETDPFLSMVQRLNASNQDKGLEHYFDSMLAASNKADGESLMLGGRIVGVVDDTGRTHTVKSLKEFRARTRRSRKTDTKQVAFTREPGKLEITPQRVIIEDAAGHRQMIDNAALDESGFALLDLGAVDDTLGYTPTVGKSFVQKALRSDLTETLTRGALHGNQAEDLLGNHVVFGSQNVIISTIKAAAKVHEVASPGWRTFDSVNYMIKSFQTVFRLPFHVANLSSGVFQTSMAGASPRNIAAAYKDTARLMFGSQDFARASNMLDDLLETDKLVSKGWRDLAGGNPSRLQQIIRQRGDGSLAAYADKLDPGFTQHERLAIRHGDGTETNLDEFVSLAAEMELYGTYASMLTRGSRSNDNTLLRLRAEILDPASVGMGKKAIRKMQAAGEATEIFNRTATALALVREGHPMRRAIEIAKEAHVPYEKLTPIEKNVIKRISMYYTFPRHYMPWAWTRFAEDPQKLARLGHLIRDQKLITTQEGKANLVVGDYRIDVGRLNANVEAAGLLGAFMDRIALPLAETALPGVSSADARQLVRAQSDAGLTGAGGVAGIMLGAQPFALGTRTQHKAPHMMEEAMRVVWPVKMMAQMMGKLPDKEGESPFVQYTPLEHWLTDSVGGVGLRKVAPNHELKRAQVEYRRQVGRLRMRAAAATDPEDRKRYLEHIKLMTYSLRQIAGEIKQKALK